MAYFSDTYLQISNRFKDWIKGDRSNTGGNVSDVTLDYANRAQDALWQYRAWCYLLKEQALTLAGTDGLTATMPSDFGRVIIVGHDANGDNKLDFFYFENGQRFNGYKMRDVFAKATGHAFTMQFFISPASTPILYYQKLLADFVGTGTEYSYFPANLINAKMEELYAIDAQMVGNDLVAIQQQLKRELRDYEQAHQYTNAEMMMQQLDVYGRPINIDSYSLDGQYMKYITRNVPSFDDGSIPTW